MRAVRSNREAGNEHMAADRSEADRAGVKRPRCSVSVHAAFMTGMPIDVALSTRFPVMPLPGKAMTALRQEVQQLVVAAERSGASVPLPVGLAHDLVHCVAFGPLRGDLLNAGAAAVHEHHVAVLGAHLLQAAVDDVRVADVLAASPWGACHRPQGNRCRRKRATGRSRRS